MNILQTTGWDDYQLIDSGDGYRLERFGNYTLSRPDPQCIWQPRLEKAAWEKADASFRKNKEGKEEWVKRTDVPAKWLMHYKGLSFYAKLSPFKHTGVFPEQHLQWDWMTEVLMGAEREVHILNLFGYTGIASLAAAKAGAKVTHVDASYPTIGWARENQTASQLEEKPIRWIMDDCLKYVKREIKRGVRYDGIIMDPPVFGHGPEGERWEFFDSFPTLLSNCRDVLSENPLFVMINAYAISASSLMLENVLADTMKGFSGSVEVGELALKETNAGRLLSTGIFGRWLRDE